MKSLIDLSSALLTDVGRICSVETARDLETLRSRAQHEGISFFTISLANFGEDFERGLEKKFVDSTLFAGWRKRGCLPAFLQGFTSRVFGAKGVIYEQPDIQAIHAVRQLTRFFKKVRIDCSKERTDRAFKRYQSNETQFRELCNLDPTRLSHFGDVCDHIWLHVFGSKEFNSYDTVPKHGPGATAERVRGNRKYSHPIWYRRLDNEFPFTEFLFSSLNQLDCTRHGIERVKLVDVAKERPVRVIGVPKTLKTPRIIAIEPVCMQYTQQAVARWIISRIEKSSLLAGAIQFTDQTVNQRLALSSSLQLDMSTIDLSDASDRVPFDMVQIMLRSQPDLLRAINACRSTRAKLPDGTIMDLKKFASMGSALCFPIESMYFTSVIVHGLLWNAGKTPDPLNIRRALRKLHLFGDDIILPVQETDSAFEALTSFNCKVNATKSFRNGSFRESCGCDAYAGMDVTPIYLREAAPRSRRNSVGLLSWVSTSNQLHMAGMWVTADYMKRVVETVLGKLPCIAETSPGLGWTSFCGTSSGRLCEKLHRPLVRTYKVQIKKDKDPLDGYPALLKYFLSCVDDRSPIPISLTDKMHLRFSARSGSVSRKRHWVPST